MSTLDTMASEQLDTHLAQLEERLGRDYTNVTRSRLHALVDRERARFAGARIHAFVPILVERAVRSALATV
ncbi:three-helix bundle dimerization domain-containing protein [Amycolatopsis sp. NPDC004169]|uniref:three-helix bundle dimerization domain-containing protein n=1 Tax=Amycolatopsis sp. NPDC004169 TaxID=3154453 RepID=UPI0033A291CA